MHYYARYCQEARWLEDVGRWWRFSFHQALALVISELDAPKTWTNPIEDKGSTSRVIMWHYLTQSSYYCMYTIISCIRVYHTHHRCSSLFFGARCHLRNWYPSRAPKELALEERRLLVEMAVEACVVQLLVTGFVHADPHEGNLRWEQTVEMSPEQLLKSNWWWWWWWWWWLWWCIWCILRVLSQ